MNIKHKMKQIGGLVIVMAALMSFTSCLNALNKTNAGDIEKLLQEKYGAEFQVISIGNRLASPGMDTVTAYCRLKSDSRVVFEAQMNVSNQLVTDNFVKRVVEVQAEKKLEEYFSREGIQAAVYATVFPVPEDVDYRNADYYQILKDTPEVSFTFKTVVSESKNDNKLYNAITNALTNYYQLNNSIKCGTTAWNISADQYDECVEKMRKGSYPPKTFFEKYSPIGTATVAIVDGKVNLESSDFRQMFYK